MLTTQLQYVVALLHCLEVLPLQPVCCPHAGEALLSCGRIAAATGAALLCENAFARLDRGAGLPDVQRLPYFPQVCEGQVWMRNTQRNAMGRH